MTEKLEGFTNAMYKEYIKHYEYSYCIILYEREGEVEHFRLVSPQYELVGEALDKSGIFKVCSYKLVDNAFECPIFDDEKRVDEALSDLNELYPDKCFRKEKCCRERIEKVRIEFETK